MNTARTIFTVIEDIWTLITEALAQPAGQNLLNELESLITGKPAQVTSANPGDRPAEKPAPGQPTIVK